MKFLLRIIAFAHQERYIFYSKTDLQLENMTLRWQIAVLKKENSRPRLSMSDRVFWVFLKYFGGNWKSSLHIVTPGTVIRWHRKSLKLYLKWLSKRGKQKNENKINKEIRRLVRRMALESGWGAPRIHGELLELD